MDPLLKSLTDEQQDHLIERLYQKGGEIRQAVLEEARKVFKDIDLHQIAEDIFWALDIIYVETLWEQSGPTRDGYVSPDDQALTMIEDEVEPYANQVWDYLQLGMKDEARTCLKGIFLGLYRFEHESHSEFKDCAVDIPHELFGMFLNNWRKKTKDYSRDTDMDEFRSHFCPGWRSCEGCRWIMAGLPVNTV
jgi:hypothetical protein